MIAMLRKLWLLQVVRPLYARAEAVMDTIPDFVIGSRQEPYLERWYLTPWSRYDRADPNPGWRVRIAKTLPQLYLHCIWRSDDDRALHDHPWFNASLILRGHYIEHTIARGGVKKATRRLTGHIKMRSPFAAHRLELQREQGPCVTLFLTGPVMRAWGFHCPDTGWRHWKDFVDARDTGKIGKGCGP